MKIENIKTTLIGGEVRDDVIVYSDNGEYVSMSKATYEAQQVEHLTEIVPASD